MTVEDFHASLFSFQPYEIITVLFDYFAVALKDAPPDKLAEFITNFHKGIVAQMEVRRRLGKK